MTPQLYHIVGYIFAVAGLIAFISIFVKLAGWKILLLALSLAYGTLGFVVLVLWLITR